MLRDKVGVKPIKFGLANIPYDNEITSASLYPTFTAFHSEACGAASTQDLQMPSKIASRARSLLPREQYFSEAPLFFAHHLRGGGRGLGR